MKERVRYAPSPTGELHLGSLRTIIFDYLVARQTDGTFIVRQEDTDRARLVEGSMHRQLLGMRWLGIESDEGMSLDKDGNMIEKGPFAPYTQSERLPIYHEHAQKLIDTGKAYRCFCTPERLDEMRVNQQANHLPPRYDRTCRTISKEESDKRAANEERFIIRQAMPETGTTSFIDVIRGEVTFPNADLDDHVLLKSDGFPTYQLANVVDDHLMEITLVIRGEEWIPSTPKNILLYQAFGWEATMPRFAHAPVILGPDGKHKLSKRDGSVAVLDYQEKGYIPEAMVNMLVFQGWSPGTEEEFFTMDELIKRFDLTRVQKSPSVFSFDRLDYVNGWYLRQLSVTEVANRMLPYLIKAGLLEKKGERLVLVDVVLHAFADANQYLIEVAKTIRERLKHFDETEEFTKFFFRRPEFAPDTIDLIVPKKQTLEGTLEILREAVLFLEKMPEPWEHDTLHEELIAFIAEQGRKNGEVLWPIRAALTGESASPGAFEMLAVLGKEESLARIHGVIEVAS